MALSTGHKLGYDITAKIAEALTVSVSALKSGAITIYPNYGESIEQDEVRLDDNTKTSAFVTVRSSGVSDPLTISTGGIINSGDLALWVFARDAYTAVQKKYEIFRSFGYVSPEGAVSKPAGAFTIGNIRVFNFDPIGGFNNVSRKWGSELYLNEEIIDFKIRIIT